ncbi:hypothetical protein [Lysobacter capsici]|uniref:hypothetical protein n=1 Tax=Lysobacter capsici TaxID=435897 RepID=UPI001C004492|nr:hypothetical protein [Lysobacter capsici]QWF15692.1 hypothetical protein KME82_18145 [Lysobacter capsici]
MSQQEYPHALDCAWIASDGQGHVAVFITAGEGPIPAQALRGDFFPVEEVESRVLRLSIRPGQAVTNLCDAPDPGSYIALAQRGVFVYDWTDFTSIKGSLNAYELVARPLLPITCADLSIDLREVAQAVRFTDVCFADASLVAVK